jgi:phytoene desaturase
MVQKKVAVVGAGIAGLASAIRIAEAGIRVDLFEKNPYTGGKMTVYEQEGYRFDAGPSLFTLPHLVDEIFELCGKNPRNYFNYRQHHTACKYFWQNGKAMVLKANLDDNIKAIEANFGHEAALSAKSYFHDSKEKYELTEPFFLQQSLHRLKTFVDRRVFKVIAGIPRLGLFSSLNKINEQYFQDQELVQLFNRYATYNGSSPYQTPGIMQMINHLEHGKGTFLPVGGMHEIAKSLTALAREVGVHVHLNQDVEKVYSQGKDIYALSVGGKKKFFDAIILNTDVHYAYEHLLDEKIKRPKKTLAQEPSTSALIFYWGINRSFGQLDLHNIFFSKDYEEEFNQIANNDNFWVDPTIYINISSKVESGDAPEGCENWFVMVNVPPNQGQDWEKITFEVRKTILSRLSVELGVDLSQHLVTERILDPTMIEELTSSKGGALYGTSSNNRMAAFLRHPNKKLKRYSGLYFCGGSAHPGGGVPLCLLSGKLAANWCLEDIHE